ncbi:MAG TPA: hypothetical protein VF077_13265 [Nitrospiraceae bacterium]
MSDREELAALRRLSELEAKARQSEMTHQASNENIPPPFVQEMSGPERVLAGIGQAYSNVGRGVGQLMGLQSPEDVRQARALDQPLLSTPGGMLGSTIGNAAVAMPLAFAPGANTVLGAGLYGAGFGAIQPAETLNERLLNAAQGGLASAGVTGAVRAAPAVFNAVVSPFTESGRGRIVGDVIERFATNPAAARQAATSNVPGVNYTLAEATADPGLAQLQRAAQASSPDVANSLAATHAANKQSVIESLQNIAGTAEERALQRGVREWLSGPLYAQAIDEGVDPAAAKALKPQIKMLLDNPFIQRVMGTAKTFAKVEGRDISKTQGDITGLHYVKLALDDAIQKGSNPTTAAGATQLRLMMQTKNDLLSVIDELSPKYAEARAAFARWSNPINRQEIGDELYKRLEPAISEFGPSVRMTPAGFTRALRDSEQTVKKATGFSQPLEDVMSPGEMDRLRGIAEYLARRAHAEEAGKVPGSPTAQYLAGGNVVQSLLGPLGLPMSWSDALLSQVFASRPISALARPLEDRIQQTLGRAVVDPRYAAAIAPGTGATGLPELFSRYALPPIAIGAPASGYSK